MSSNKPDIKDVNDQVRAWVKAGVPLDQQRVRVEAWMQNAEPFLVVEARRIGEIVNISEKAEALNAFFRGVVAPLGVDDRAGFREVLIKELGIKSTQWTERLKALADAARNAGDGDEVEEVACMGGWFPDDESERSGWLLEPYFDRKTGLTRWAYARISDMEQDAREISTADDLVIGNRKLVPLMDDNIRYETVILANGLGPLRTTGELIEEIERFVRRYFLMDEASRYKLSAMYAIFTWVYDAFDALNFLRAMGGSGAGKSDLMYLVGLCSYRLMVTLAVSSTASYKGLAHLYKGTLFIDEAQDLMKKDDGTMRALLKGRATKRYANVVNMMEVQSPSGKTFVPSTSQVYGPTLITMYGAFDDAGIENRCVSFNLSQKDTLELDRVGIEPGYYPPELGEWAERIRGMCLHWRLRNWRPNIELTAEERAAHKLSDPLVSPRVNQVMRPMKVLAIKQGDLQLFGELMQIGQANYEDEMTKRAGSFEAMVLRAVVAADVREGYADKVKEGRLGKLGSQRYILYKDLAAITNELLDVENIADGAADDKKKAGVKSKTIGDICRETFRFPVWRTGEGWAVVLDRDRIEIGKLRFGLDREEKEAAGAAGEALVAAAGEPEQLGLSDSAVWIEDGPEEGWGL